MADNLIEQASSQQSVLHDFYSEKEAQNFDFE